MSTSAPLLARLLITAATLAYGIGPSIMDILAVLAIVALLIGGLYSLE